MIDVPVEIIHIEYDAIFWFFRRPRKVKIKIGGELAGVFEVSHMTRTGIHLYNDDGHIHAYGGRKSIYILFSISFDLIPTRLIESKLPSSKWGYIQIHMADRSTAMGMGGGGYMKLVKQKGEL